MRFAQRVKEHAKGVLKQALLSAHPRDNRARILTYHSVGERDHPMNVSVNDFEDQMAWLGDTLPVIAVRQALAGEPGIAVTFDDGYRDNLTNVLPVMLRRDIPWTLFMVADRAGGQLDHDRDSPHARLLDWNEVRELHQSGTEIGAHTMTHARLARLTVEEQRAEIEGCFQRLQEELQTPPQGFAYPYGSLLDYNTHSVRIVQEVGFQYGLSNRYGPVNPSSDIWTAHRIWIDRTDSLETFQQKVDGRLDRLSVLDSPLGIRLRRLVATVSR